MGRNRNAGLVRIDSKVNVASTIISDRLGFRKTNDKVAPKVKIANAVPKVSVK
jgi:hypothetical protein